MTSPTPTVGRRQHLANRWWGPGGLTIRCTCGSWQSTPGPRREQNAAHREHRWRMGEIAKPARLSPMEQLRVELEALREVRDLARQLSELGERIEACAADTQYREAAAGIKLLLDRAS